MVPSFPTERGAGVYFLARAEGLIYTAESAFRATFESSPPMSTAASVPAGILATSFPERAHAEEDQFPVLAYFQNLASDFWFWEFLFAGDDTLDTKALTVRAPAVAGTGAARLVVHLMGGSDVGVPGEHHVTVSLNGNVLGDVTWDGTTRHDAVFTLAAGDVVEFAATHARRRAATAARAHGSGRLRPRAGEAPLRPRSWPDRYRSTRRRGRRESL